MGEVEAEHKSVFVWQNKNGSRWYFDTVKQIVDFFLLSLVDEQIVVASGKNEQLVAGHHSSDQAVALVHFVHVYNFPVLSRVFRDVISWGDKYRVGLLAVG